MITGLTHLSRVFSPFVYEIVVLEKLLSKLCNCHFKFVLFKLFISMLELEIVIDNGDSFCGKAIPVLAKLLISLNKVKVSI